ncbi:MAG: response regulator [Desulfobacterales bacterium]|nr:response regulator [Desulfobacterales bacterium]
MDTSKEAALQKRVLQLESAIQAIIQGEVDAVVSPTEISMLHFKKVIKEKEYQLEISQENLKSLFETLDDFLFVISQTGIILHVNPEVSKRLLLPQDTLLGKAFVELYPESVREFVWKKMYSMENQHKAVFEFPMQTLDEAQIPTETRLTQGIWNKEKVIFAISRDISLRKQAEEQLLKAMNLANDLAKEAASANKAKSRFIANMSHELRTPLNSILGYAQILKRDQELSQKHQDAVHTIYSSGLHLLQMINDILDLSKIEVHRMQLTPSMFELRPFLSDLVNIILIRVHQKGLQFEYQPDLVLPKAIWADELRLRQIVLNLLGNAVKFTHQGSIIFRVQHIHTELEQKKTMVTLRFSVIDTGIGIPSDQFENIFSPFHQLVDHQNHAEGTGLGLSISRSLVKLMNSDLLVESSIDKGSRFWFDLTVEEGIISSNAKESAFITGYKGEKKHILVVDDTSENRSVLRDILTPLGFIIHEALNGKQAIEMFRRIPIDIVLMDMVMPEMDGFTAAQQIRQQSMTIPIIAISASIDGNIKDRAIKAGCNDYISKPIQVDLLVSCIGQMLALDWTYGRNELSQQKEHDTTEISAPPSDILKKLLHWVTLGDVKNISKEAEWMMTQETLKPFGHKLYQLARRFEINQIDAFVRQFLLTNK